jgi:hypothetical protein
MGYVDDAFDKLKETLEITKTEEQFAAKRHIAIRDHVRETWDLDDDFLTGSYRRETKTKKLKDVDIFVVLKPDGSQGSLRKKTPTAVLTELKTVLDAKYDTVTIDQMAATITFGSGEDIVSFDVVPAFKRTAAGKGYEIPDTATGSWIATNPKTHHEQSTAKNKDCDGKYVPLIKMVKGINQELGEPVRSFLLEVMGQCIIKAPFGRYQDEVRWFLANAADAVLRDWPDPAKLGPNVNTLTISERAVAQNALNNALAVAEEAIRLEDDGQERAAVEEWRKLFSWRMPRP